MTEIHYRRLLALYPRDFRREYGEEMLAVLMDDDRPGPAQALDIVRAAVTVRLRQAAAATGWRRAAWVVQVFGAVLLLAVALRRQAGWPVALLQYPEREFRFDALDWTRVAGWAVVVVAALLGLRLLGLAGAAVGLAGETASPARSYLDTPATVLYAYWIIVAAVVVLLAGLVAIRGERLRGRVPLALAALALVLHGVAGPWVFWDRYPMVLRHLGEGQAYVALACLVAVPALLLLAVWRQEAVVRRWTLAWAAPVLVSFPLVKSGFGAFIEHNMRHPEATRLISPVQWATLVFVPALAFLIVAAALTRAPGFLVGGPGHVRVHE